MRFNYLGHACWLLEASGLRIALDPLLRERHAGGVFEVVPRRRVDEASLRADFVFVSHSHFDHFDIESLGLLAAQDPDSVLVTSDELVERAATVLGFRTVHRVSPGTKVELSGGLSFTTTPSFAPDVEWGTVFADDSGVAWNLIDTVFPSPADVARIRDSAVEGRKIDLALAPIQTLREIALSTADFVGFRPHDHAHLLACAAATGARTITPSACGEAFAAPYAAMNRYVYPVSRARAARDLKRYAPGTRTVIPEIGESLVIEGGEVSLGKGTVAFERLGSGEDPRHFAPIEPAAVFDPNLDGRRSVEMRDAIGRWAKDDLAPALAKALGDRGDLAGISLVLEVVLPDDRIAFRLDTRGGVEHRDDPEYDVRVVVAASMLLDVIEGRRAWVEPLLAGLLRSSVRGAHIAEGVCAPLSIAPMFPYYAIPYRQSVERSVMWRARAWVEGRP